MSETARFFLGLAASAAVAAAALLALRSRRAADLAAGAFLAICLVPAAALLLARVAILAGLLQTAPATQSAYSASRWIVLGIAAAAAVVSRSVRRDPPLAFARSRAVLLGLCAFAALGYLATEAGKLAHDAEMREFFTSSGLPVWAMYAVMSAEILGAIGLLVRPLRVHAAAGLSLVMLGAIGIHAKNGDPFSDSLDAVRFLVLLGVIAVLARQARLPGRGPSSTSSRSS